MLSVVTIIKWLNFKKEEKAKEEKPPRHRSLQMINSWHTSRPLSMDAVMLKQLHLLS